MTRHLLVTTLTAALAFATVTVGAAQESSFVKLNSRQIKARFPGKELTDEAHYAFRFDRNGRIAIISMGKHSQGKWRIAKDTFCLVLDEPVEQSEENCYQVWMAGNQVELRAADNLPVLPIEGILQRPQVRQ